jgi:hypothetical protein
VKAPIRVTPGIDDSPELARVLGDHARAIATTPREQALFLLGHGPNDAEEYARWMERLRPIGDSIRLHAGFRDVRIDLVRDDAPRVVRAEAVRRVRELIELQHEVTGRDVVVIPVLISSGSLSHDQIPTDLQSLPIVYSGAGLLPSAEMARWVERRVRETVAVQR